MQGWISIHRKLLKNPLVSRDADYLGVWIYLLLNATHKEYDVMFGGKQKTLKPGQLITSRKSISNFLKMNPSKCERILKKYQTEHQIEQETCNQNRVITICKWLDYQQTEQQTEQQANNKRTTSEQQANTNNNINNVNKETIKEICDFFEISEMNHFNAYSAINKFVTTITHKNKLAHFTTQFKYYRLFKKESKQHIHNWQSYIGSGEQLFEDGAWNKENWQKKYDDYMRLNKADAEKNVYRIKTTV